MIDWVPYVYIIKNKTTNLRYLGVRYAKGCNPLDLWNTYFTSSTLVKKLIKEYGKDDFVYKIIHIFPNNPEDAILKEAYYFKFIKNRDNYLNCCYSSGILDLRLASKAGKVGGSITRDRKIGIFRSDAERKLWCSMGGKIGGKKQAELGLGFHQYKNNPELHKLWSSKGGQIGCKKNGWDDPLVQSNNGKKGGIKNKGFIWLTDGNITLKYTKTDQEYLTVEQFLIKNPQFKKGRKLVNKD